MEYEQVYDISFARRIALLEQAEEVVQKIGSGKTMLASACPGFVLYVEKKHGEEVLEHISRVKSPQGVMGSIVKQMLPRVLDESLLRNRRVWHACVMPCHDKKMEAARDELKYEKEPEVDVVITSAELDQFMTQMSWYERSFPCH